jgi:hypothetical protein
MQILNLNDSHYHWLHGPTNSIFTNIKMNILFAPFNKILNFLTHEF